MMIMRIQFSAFIEACSVEDCAYLMRSLIRNPGGVAECRGMSDCATSRRPKNSSSPAVQQTSRGTSLIGLFSRPVLEATRGPSKGAPKAVSRRARE